MAKAVKSPSGKWQCRGYNRELKKQRMFTADTKKEAERLAAIFSRETQEERNASVTFQKAAETFLFTRSAVLSPNTLSGYRSILRNLGALYDVRVSDMSERFLQAFVNDLAKNVSPKTVSNRYNFITAVIRSVYPEKVYHTRLPERRKPKIKMPSEGDIKRLLAAVEDTPLEVPVLLALFGPMRRGEICALRADHIHGNTVHVEYAIAMDEYGSLITKAPKTASGDRFIQYPSFVIDKLPKYGRVTDLTPQAITGRMQKLSKRINFPYTFHQLRHWSVSYLHRAGLSDQEILDRAGWSSTGIFKEVYRHGLNEKDRAVDAFEKFKR